MQVGKPVCKFGFLDASGDVCILASTATSYHFLHTCTQGLLMSDAEYAAQKLVSSKYGI